ncbi:MAG: hypothetical protein EZS28_023357 [Streblomastix strix]|uniref:Uncharacterized protein n=1 Tax=Streblomastix strix TaxID=222440 RepID=A0A5J4VEY3_9EUKA|nr:MAG: hypothetical protein EZS28_023357 [Streblomastix strix]
MSRFFRAGPIGGCPESQQTNEELISLPEDCLFQDVLGFLLYFDPSFYLSSNTTVNVFFILFAFMLFTTVFIFVLITIINKQEKIVPEDLQFLSQHLIWMTIFISPGIMYNIMTRPLNCIIHQDKIFGDYCHPKLNLVEAII